MTRNTLRRVYPVESEGIRSYSACSVIRCANSQSKITLPGSFSRSQVSAALATLVDYALLFSLVEIVHVWYVFAVALGALAGATTSFLLNRHWSFEAADGPWGGQARRYALISGASLILNTGGVWFFTDSLGLRYYESVLLVSISVGFLFNYPMHRFYVFEGREKLEKLEKRGKKEKA